jgi:hypothetical protein
VSAQAGSAGDNDADAEECADAGALEALEIRVTEMKVQIDKLLAGVDRLVAAIPTPAATPAATAAMD